MQTHIEPVFRLVWSEAAGAYEETDERIGFQAVAPNGRVLAYGDMGIWECGYTPERRCCCALARSATMRGHSPYRPRGEIPKRLACHAHGIGSPVRHRTTDRVVLSNWPCRETGMSRGYGFGRPRGRLFDLCLPSVSSSSW